MSAPQRPGPGLRERKKAKTRRAIQEHAIRLIAEQGYEGTTVEQIAEAAEVSPSTFFRYFPTKEDVILQDDYDPLITEMLARQPSDAPPLTAIRTAMRMAFEQIPPEEERQIHLRARLQLSHPALRSRSLDNMTRTMDVITTTFARRLGRSPDDLMVRALGGAIVGTMIPVLDLWARSDGSRRLADLIDAALAYLEAGFPPGET